MSYDIQLDMADLTALASDLATVIDEFEKANGNASEVAEATGSSSLQGKVEEFAKAWDLRRDNMIENIKVLQQTISMITENFTEVDEELARALEEAAEEPPSADSYQSPQAV